MNLSLRAEPATFEAQTELYYLLRRACLRAAHRAFINWESLLRPAAVIPPFLSTIGVRFAPSPRFCLAHRALAAAAILARVAADILRASALGITCAEAPPRSKERRLCRLSICRRIETACSKELRDRSMCRHIAAIEVNANTNGLGLTSVC